MTKRNSQFRRINLTLDERTYDPLTKLDCFVEECRSPSFDLPVLPIAVLEVTKTIITRTMVHKMIDLLNLPFVKDPFGASYKDFRWISIALERNTKLAQPHHDEITNETDYCTLDDILRFFFAMTHRAPQVAIRFCPEILASFLSIGQQHAPLGAIVLIIEESEVLSARQYTQLGKVIQRSDKLRILHLHLRIVDEAHGLFAGLANAVNVQDLTLEDTSQQLLEEKHIADDLVVGKIGGNGPLMRFIQCRQNPLNTLSLTKLGLQDSHLVAILQAIPTHQIENLNFTKNLIDLQGMLEFAKLLPKMPSLRYFCCEENPWEKSSTSLNTVGEALLQGLMENTSVCTIGAIEHLPQFLQFWHYLVLNRAGRRILTSCKPIADSLWPLVLERAQMEGLYDNLTFAVFFIEDYHCKASAIYFFLQNYPKILSFHGL